MDFTAKKIASCLDNCNNRGVCHSGTCFCSPGFAGHNCVPVGMLELIVEGGSENPFEGHDQPVRHSANAHAYPRRPLFVIVFGVLGVAILIAFCLWLSARRSQMRRAVNDRESPSPVSAETAHPWWR
eukprot:INCI15054.1.p2 GENE.INCI15054.1~~INCI15054.1.p2  ORF type:complete len:127 (-),score=12.70 INCI15054.1:85-465(-)